jgi:hypothetical protein
MSVDTGRLRRSAGVLAVVIVGLALNACGEDRVEVGAEGSAATCPQPQPPENASGKAATLEEQLAATRQWQADQAASSRASTSDGTSVSVTISYPSLRSVTSLDTLLAGLPKGSRITALYGGLDTVTGGFYRSFMNLAGARNDASQGVKTAQSDLKSQLASIAAGSRNMADNASISPGDRAAAGRNADELEKLAAGAESTALPVFATVVQTTYSKSWATDVQRDGVVASVAPSGCPPIEPLYPHEATESWVRLADAQAKSTTTSVPPAVDLPPSAIAPDGSVDPALLTEVANAPSSKGS